MLSYQEMPNFLSNLNIRYSCLHRTILRSIVDKIRIHVSNFIRRSYAQSHSFLHFTTPMLCHIIFILLKQVFAGATDTRNHRRKFVNNCKFSAVILKKYITFKGLSCMSCLSNYGTHLQLHALWCVPSFKAWWRVFKTET